MAQSEWSTLRNGFRRLGVGSAFGGHRIRYRLNSADGAEELRNRFGRNVPYQATTGAVLPGLYRGAKRGNLAIDAVAETKFAARPLHHVVAVAGTGEQKMMPPLPEHPDLRDAFVPVPHEA